jgi:hypothetical protein
MSSFVTATYRETYRSHVRMALQQNKSKLIDAITAADVKGEMHKIEDIVGHVKPWNKTGRFEDTPILNTPHDGRWLAMPGTFGFSETVDSEDKLAGLIDIQGAYVKAAAASIARGTDDRIIGAFFNPAQTGKKGTILKNFDTGNIVPFNEGGSTGPMTAQKLLAAREVLVGNYVDIDMDELFVALTARAERQLFNDVQVTSRDFGATGMEIREGRISRLAGFNIICIELGNPMFDNAALTLDGNGRRKTPFWAKSAMFGGFWEREFSSVDLVPMKHHSSLVYARRQFDATRTEEGGVGYIENSE